MEERQWLVTYSGDIFYCRKLPSDRSLFRAEFYFSMFNVLFLCGRNSTRHGHVTIFLLLKLNNPGGDSLCKYVTKNTERLSNSPAERKGPARPPHAARKHSLVLWSFP